ncbi:POK9 protein, partial [Malurus elegans]|nr:POK9 protein [Malurus elegans]
RGSHGLDLGTAIDITLIDQQPTKIPMAIKGPVVINGQPQGALLFGRSSSGIKGLFLFPGVIDTDCTGEICIVAQAMFLPIHIPRGSRIAQLVPVPLLTAEMRSTGEIERGEAGFCSTGGLALLTIPM